DGSHLFEDALADFLRIEALIEPGQRCVIAFDDVLPYNHAIAVREQPPGDWAGDVWKVGEILTEHRPDLELIWADVAPTGLLVVLGARRRMLSDPGFRLSAGLDDRTYLGRAPLDALLDEWRPERPVPERILQRSFARPATAVVDAVKA